MVSQHGLSSGPTPPSGVLSLHITIDQKYPAKQHARNVASRLQKLESSSLTSSYALIFLRGQPSILLEDSDQPRPFRQRRYFHYLTGVAHLSDCAVTYDIARDELILYIPPLDPKEVLWTGMPPGRDECMREYDVDDVRYMTELDDNVMQWGHRTLIEFQDYNAEQTLRGVKLRRKPKMFCLTEEEALLARSVGTKVPMRVNTTTLRQAIDDCRVYKDEYEIGLLRKAIAVSKAAHEAIIARLRRPHKGAEDASSRPLWPVPKTEADLEATFISTCIAQNAKSQAYEPIVGSGRNCATLHYTANNAPLAGKQLLLVDAGAEWENYASDITRTYPISETWTKEAKGVYDIVERMQKETIEMTVDGMSWRKTHFHAARVAVEGLLGLGVLKGGDVEEILKAGTWRAFFPHGLGHMIGLETHDVEGTKDDDSGYKPHDARGSPSTEEVLLRQHLPQFPFPGQKRPSLPPAPSHSPRQRSSNNNNHIPPPPPPMTTLINRILKAGMVVTVEPGIYFCEWIIRPYLSDPVHGKYIGAELLERYWDVGGVRIEDMVLVKEKGNEVLSRDIPRGW